MSNYLVQFQTSTPPPPFISQFPLRTPAYRGSHSELRVTAKSIPSKSARKNVSLCSSTSSLCVNLCIQFIGLRQSMYILHRFASVYVYFIGLRQRMYASSVCVDRWYRTHHGWNKGAFLSLAIEHLLLGDWFLAHFTVRTFILNFQAKFHRYSLSSPPLQKQTNKTNKQTKPNIKTKPLGAVWLSSDGYQIFHQREIFSQALVKRKVTLEAKKNTMPLSHARSCDT